MDLKEKKEKTPSGMYIYTEEIIGLLVHIVFKDGREDIGIINWLSDDDKEDEDGNPIYGFELVDKDIHFDKYSFCEDETESITIIE